MFQFNLILILVYPRYYIPCFFRCNLVMYAFIPPKSMFEFTYVSNEHL